MAAFIRQHEKALANSLQLSVARRQSSQNASTSSLPTPASTSTSGATPISNSSLAAAFSFAGLNFISHPIKPAHLTLTPHHLFYLLSRIEELGVAIGPMNVRLENIHTDPSPANYVSFLRPRQPRPSRTDKESIHSVSSMRSFVSSMSAFWSSLGLGSASSRSEKAKAAVEADLKYLYSAFTKLPSLRLAPDHKARLIKGYEEFPFDTAVPLFAFKNLQQLDIIDMDFRQFYGWDRLADQLCLLTVKRGNVEDPTDLITNIVLDDAERRRKRSNKGGRTSPTSSWAVPSTPRAELQRSNSDPCSPTEGSPKNFEEDHEDPGTEKTNHDEVGSVSPKRPPYARPASSYRHIRTHSKAKRSYSGSSNSSDFSLLPHRSESASSLLAMNVLPASRWQRLKYLSLSDNSLTSLSAKSIMPLAPSLRSLNLSSNLFTEIPESLASLTRLASLDLSHCMIESLQSLTRNPLPAILTLKLKANRLESLAGVERLLSLENLNVQGNLLHDPAEAARLTGIPNLRRIWVKNNPFTKRFSDYRIRIFNLFRTTPGYLEDILIDDYGPGYNERKHLAERVPEIERPPPVRAVQIVEPPLLIQASQSPDPIREQRPGEAAGLQAQNSFMEITTPSPRRKKTSRRRIVDLSRDDSEIPNAEIGSPDQNAVRRTLDTHEEAEVSSTPRKPPSISSHNEPTPKPNRLETRPAAETNLVGDDYRSRIEALRLEFGNNWISALSEQGWHGNQDLSSDAFLPFRHAPLHRANSNVIVSTGRTLG